MATQRDAKRTESSATPSIRPSAEEIARRQRLLTETFRLRDAMGSINLSVAELLADDEDEVNA